jgi:hypothetical protein
MVFGMQLKLPISEIDPSIQHEACVRLQKLVNSTKRSFSHLNYVKHSKASKLGWQKRKAGR